MFVDNSPKFIKEAELLVWSLIRLARVDPNRIFLHKPFDLNSSRFPLASELGAQFVSIPRWGEDRDTRFSGGFCNKVMQLTHGLPDLGEDVVFLDCDIVATRPFSIPVSGVAGKPADVCPIPIQTLAGVYGKAGVKLVTGRSELDRAVIPRSWFNAGVLAVKRDQVRQVGSTWAAWAEWMEREVGQRNVLENIDEISLALAIQSEGFSFRRLDAKFNFVANKQRAVVHDRDPILVHYRGHFARNGVLRSVPNRRGLLASSPRANRRIKKLNRQLLAFYRDLASAHGD